VVTIEEGRANANDILLRTIRMEQGVISSVFGVTVNLLLCDRRGSLYSVHVTKSNIVST
jgi:hypothetical protein